MKMKKTLAGLLACLTVSNSMMFSAKADEANGDVNADGNVTVSDAILVARMAVEDITVNVSAPEQADVNCDGVVNGEDVTKILRTVAKFTEPQTEPKASTNLMEGISAAAVSGKDADDAFIHGQTEFSLNLLKQAAAEEVKKEDSGNILISPLSVVMALGMTANGAQGDTLAGMEKALGGVPIDDLDAYLLTQRKKIAEKQLIHMANGIWFRDDGSFELPLTEFLQKNANYYDAGLYAAPFNKTTLDEINGFVNTHTHEMIPEVLKTIPKEAVMILVNALAFEAEWEQQYEEYMVREREFAPYQGEKQTAEMMLSDERFYLEDENATGFAKFYKADDCGNSDYYFAALLPKEGVDIYDYVAELDAESLHSTLEKGTASMIPRNWDLTAGLPKFEYDYDIILDDSLCAMGMDLAFSNEADFGAMYEHATVEDVHIGTVIHKTHIEVMESGTKAAAVTAVMMDGGAAFDPVERVQKTVILDRPFVYAIVDAETNLPVFMGTVTELG